MSRQYRVVDLSSEVAQSVEKMITASTPEGAASAALGIELVRSGAKEHLVARVYWQITDEATNMVRLYRKVEGTRRR